MILGLALLFSTRKEVLLMGSEERLFWCWSMELLANLVGSWSLWEACRSSGAFSKEYGLLMNSMLALCEKNWSFCIYISFSLWIYGDLRW